MFLPDYKFESHVAYSMALYPKASNVSLLNIPRSAILCKLMKTTKLMKYGRNEIFIHDKSKITNKKIV